MVYVDHKIYWPSASFESLPNSLLFVCSQSAFTCHVKNVDGINKTYERKSERKSI